MTTDVLGEQIVEATSPLDGLCYLGSVLRVEPVCRKATTDPIPGLAKLIMQSSQGEFRVDLAKTAKQMTGDVELAAFDTLVQAMPGTRWIVKVWRNTSTTDGKQYTNFTAVDAARI